MEKLKPCPFCGGKAMLYAKTGLTTIGIYAVRCLKCSAGFSYTFATEELAIETWNRRADDIDIPIYDKETRIDNCTVQILENAKTGRISVGWWRNE